MKFIKTAIIILILFLSVNVFAQRFDGISDDDVAYLENQFYLTCTSVSWSTVDDLNTELGQVEKQFNEYDFFFYTGLYPTYYNGYLNDVMLRIDVAYPNMDLILSGEYMYNKPFDNTTGTYAPSGYIDTYNARYPEEPEEPETLEDAVNQLNETITISFYIIFAVGFIWCMISGIKLMNS